MYIARLYEKITDPKKRFLRKLIELPEPEFIILYNGKSPYPDQKGNSLYEAVRLAVKYCIDNNVLRDFLRKHGSEVFNMLYSEYSFDEEAAVIREEGMEKEKLIIAKNLLEKGSTIEFVHVITGLSLEEIAEFK
jgi:hypothetical protein